MRYGGKKLIKHVHIDFSLSFFHIYLQSLSVKTAEIHGNSWYQKWYNAKSSSLPFFEINLNVKIRKKCHRETKGQRQLSPFCRRQELKFVKESLLARACELLVCLLIGSNIFSKGEFWGKGITPEMKIIVPQLLTSELRSMSKLLGLFQVLFVLFLLLNTQAQYFVFELKLFVL